MSSTETSITDDYVDETSVGEQSVAEASQPSVPYSGPARSGAMTRIDCARPLCAEAATARFMIDAVHKLVIVDSRIDEWGASGSVCTKHANRLKAPNGWTLEDRREGFGETGSTPIATATATSPLLSRAFASLANIDQGSGLSSLFPAASARRSVS
jgi:hypothetical protein